MLNRDVAESVVNVGVPSGAEHLRERAIDIAMAADNDWDALNYVKYFVLEQGYNSTEPSKTN